MPTTVSEPLSLIDDTFATKLLTGLVAIPGKSGDEQATAARIVKELTAAGVPLSAITYDDAHKKSPYGGQCGNLIVKLPGTLRGPRRMLMAHIDTVPLCVGCEPEVRGDYLVSKRSDTALGGDDRAGASVVLHTALMLQKHKVPHPPLTLFWPVQEEVGLVGARNVAVSKLGGPKLCFNWDGGDASLVTIGATGADDLQITIKGLAAHAGAHPEDGVSAAVIAAKAIASLAENGWHGLVVKGRKTGTSNIGIVQGGDATNVVLDHLFLRGEARSHDPEFRARIVKEFERAFVMAAKSTSNTSKVRGEVEFTATMKYESFRLPEDSPVIAAASSAIRTVGLEPVTKISNGGLDANWMTALGLPTVTLGCGQEAIHTVKERLHLPSYLKACRIGLLLATGAL
jgi:tripeptide aminopeptidase